MSMIILPVGFNQQLSLTNMQIIDYNTKYTTDLMLSNMIQRLDEAVNVCQTSPDIEDQGYPYATGYSMSAMSAVVEQLTEMQQQLQESM